MDCGGFGKGRGRGKTEVRAQRSEVGKGQGKEGGEQGVEKDQPIDFIDGGSAWESNPPIEVLARYTGFEVREPHQ